MAIDSIVESEKNRVRYLRVEEANDVSYDDVESLFDDDFNGEYLLDISECQSYDPPTKYLSPFISLMISKGVNLKINGSQKRRLI